jgi:hypothetical protein
LFAAREASSPYSVCAAVEFAACTSISLLALHITLWTAPAFAATLKLSPLSYTTTSGGDGGQPVTNLVLRDQSRAQNDFDKYVEFTTPDDVAYDGYRTYSLPLGVSPAALRTIRVKTNYMGAAQSEQLWRWSIYDWTAAAWVTVGDNKRARSWRWRSLSFRVKGTLADFVDPSTGEIRVRLQSADGTDDADIDYEAVWVTIRGPLPPTPTPTPSATPVPPTIPPGIWQPALTTSWQWQLSDLPVDQSVDVAMYDIDLFDNDAGVVGSLHAQGRKVVCYMSAGSWESFRPDADQFPASVKGNVLAGFPDERWLDVRRIDLLAPIMEARLDLCRAKGFDAVEADNVDGYANSSGFPLTYQDQLAYNIFLANAAHARGLSIGLKNDLGQIGDLLPYFDWALNEQCFQYDECDLLLPFINAGKAVFTVEYALAPNQFCGQANAMNFNALKKRESLDAYRVACR